MIFVLLHDPTGDRALAFSGMDAATVSALLAPLGFLFDIVDSATYTAFVLAHPVLALTGPALTSAQRAEAVDAITNDPRYPNKLERAIILVILDEINLIRSLLQPAQAARTIAQLKTAIQSKINAGSAD